MIFVDQIMQRFSFFFLFFFFAGYVGGQIALQITDYGTHSVTFRQMGIHMGKSSRKNRGHHRTSDDGGRWERFKQAFC